MIVPSPPSVVLIVVISRVVIVAPPPVVIRAPATRSLALRLREEAEHILIAVLIVEHRVAHVVLSCVALIRFVRRL